MKMTITNISIILGALAVAYALNKAVKQKQAIESVNNVQYVPSWADDKTVYKMV